MQVPHKQSNTGISVIQGLDIPRILEVCGFAPNVIVYGDHAYDFLAQNALEYYFHKLNGTVADYFESIRNKKPS